MKYQVGDQFRAKQGYVNYCNGLNKEWPKSKYFCSSCGTQFGNHLISVNDEFEIVGVVEDKAYDLLNKKLNCVQEYCMMGPNNCWNDFSLDVAFDKYDPENEIVFTITK